ncbi:MAG: CpsD/CapB family tyrosine-protein kinase [Oscillospiraceae bacterium]|jgi:capsular exopolysaccharide synthesis family protein|nr:CpsD/CapB family tyrosine-protein kinase [Oscillospiraceae bacterium]
MRQEQGYAPSESARPQRGEYVPDGGFDMFRQVDYARLLRAVLRRAWVAVLVGGLLASGMYFASKQKASQTFSTQARIAFTIIVYSTQVQNAGGGAPVIAEIPRRDYYDKANLARLSEMLKGDRIMELLRDEIKTKYHAEYLPEALRNAITMEATQDTAVFVLSVTSRNDVFCNRTMERLIAIFPDYLKEFQSTLEIEIVRRPNSATVVLNTDESRQAALMGALAGGGAVCALFAFLELRRNTVRSGQDVRSRTAERMLGMTPFQPRRRRLRRKEGDRVPHIGDKRAVSFDFVENIKAIRAKLENIAEGWGAKVFAVTSTFESEGKTTLSVNIACALAQMGKNVLLIDCDLRKPAVCRGLGIPENDAVGVLQILNGKATYEESVKYCKPLRVFLLATGGTTEHPPERLSSEGMREILKKARTEFDYIILDTPPARVVSDCITMAPLMDGLIYAIRYDFARVQQINETLDEVNAAGIRVVGSVLTMAAPENLVRRNGYSAPYRRPGKYYGGFGYGFGHSAEERYGHYGRYSYGGYGRNRSGQGAEQEEEL